MFYNNALVLLELSDSESVNELYTKISSMYSDYEIVNIDNTNYSVKAFGYIDRKVGGELLLLIISIKFIVGSKYMVLLWLTRPVISYDFKGSCLAKKILDYVFNHSKHIKVRRIYVIEESITRSLIEHLENISEDLIYINKTGNVTQCSSVLNSILKRILYPFYVYRSTKLLEYMSFALHDVNIVLEEYYGKTLFSRLLLELIESIQSVLQLRFNRVLALVTFYAAVLTVVLTIIMRLIIDFLVNYIVIPQYDKLFEIMRFIISVLKHI